MKFTSIRLQNFRGFRDVSLELKPLTVLLGPNSAGKSSFGHALSAMAHAQSEFGGSGRATLTARSAKDAESWPVDLGSHPDVLTHDTDDKRVRVGLGTSMHEIELGFGGVTGRDDLLLSSMRHPIDPASSQVTSVTPIVDAIESLGTSSVRELGPVTRPPQGFLVERLNENEWRDSAGSDMVVALDGLILETLRHRTGTDISFDTTIDVALRRLLQNLTYLRAGRRRPARSYERRGTIDQFNPLGYAGEWTAEVLERQRSQTVSFFEPPVLPRSSHDVVTLEPVWLPRERALAAAVGGWLQHLGLAKTVTSHPSQRFPGRIETRLNLGDAQRTRNLLDVGYGVSQVLPVLVGGLLQHEDSLFIVDLPEAHLHPQPQSRLADFFCSLALLGRVSLVETHSEAFFHRLRLRAAFDPRLLELIAVYFIDQPGSDGRCSAPRRIGLTFEEEVKWPAGFLEEGWHTENLIAAARDAAATK